MTAQTASAPPATGFARIASGSFAVLPDWACLDVEGADAEAFLQAQLTNDLAALGPHGCGPGGYCTPRGRLLATFMLARRPAGFRLFVTRDLAAALARRLAMYVLRARVRVIDRSSELGVIGVHGAAAAGALADAGLAPPAPGEVAGDDDACVLGLAPATVDGTGIARWLAALPEARISALVARLAGTMNAVDPAFDRWLEVRSGIARVTAATSEAWVPQMVNQDLVDAVSFRKGCYPGQEVVARMQYRGRVRRRMRLGRLDRVPEDPAAWMPGADVLGDGEREPAGTVVLAAPAPDGGVELLFESRLARGEVPLRVAGEPLRDLELPYPLPASGPVTER